MSFFAETEGQEAHISSPWPPGGSRNAPTIKDGSLDRNVDASIARTIILGELLVGERGVLGRVQLDGLGSHFTDSLGHVGLG